MTNPLPHDLTSGLIEHIHFPRLSPGDPRRNQSLQRLVPNCSIGDYSLDLGTLPRAVPRTGSAGSTREGSFSSIYHSGSTADHHRGRLWIKARPKGRYQVGERACGGEHPQGDCGAQLRVGRRSTYSRVDLMLRQMASGLTGMEDMVTSRAGDRPQWPWNCLHRRCRSECQGNPARHH